jgi:L-asparagine transporter-like permease
MKTTTILCTVLMFFVLVIDAFKHNFSDSLTALSAMLAWLVVGLYEIRIKRNDKFYDR